MYDPVYNNNKIICYVLYLIYLMLCFIVFSALYLNILGLVFIVSLCVLDGLVIYGVYSGCDLLKSKKITSNDQVSQRRQSNNIHVE